MKGDSARPLGNSRLSYRSLKLMRRGVDGHAIGDGFAAVHESGYGPSATSLGEPGMSAFWGEVVMSQTSAEVRVDPEQTSLVRKTVAHSPLMLAAFMIG